MVVELSKKEMHETLTEFNISVAFKLTFCRFLNTALVPLIVNIKAESWFQDGGLVTDIFYIIVSLSFK